jgi:antitoxin component of MazEF toxin-antitoxin module
MARRSLEEREIRSLTKAAGGRSYSVTIPKEHIKKLKWRAKQKLTVTMYRDRIIIKDWKPSSK